MEDGEDGCRRRSGRLGTIAEVVWVKRRSRRWEEMGEEEEEEEIEGRKRGGRTSLLAMGKKPVGESATELEEKKMGLGRENGRRKTHRRKRGYDIFNFYG